MMGRSTTKTADDTLSRLVEFEERAAALFLQLARRFTENKELSWFWVEMSLEEKQHAVLLDFCAKEQIVTAAMPDRHTIRKLSSFLSSLEKRAARSNLSVDDAFALAAALEGSEINDIYARLIGPIQGTWHVARKKIETLAPEHMQALIRAARKFGASASTMAALTEIKSRPARETISRR